MLSRLQGKHWALIGGYLTSVALLIGGLDHWHDLLNPPIVAGLLAQTGSFLGALFAGAPPNPNITETNHPARRADDDPPLGSVSEATRSHL